MTVDLKNLAFDGKSLIMLLSEGQVSDYKGARHIVQTLPCAEYMLADCGYDADWFREVLRGKGIEPCIPPKKNREKDIPYDKALYKGRHKVENMFGRLKDWRRIATRYDRCADIFMAAITLAAAAIWWI